jgi:four helix bundle protein
MDQFDFEKLDVYHVAMDFAVTAYEIARSATRGEGFGDLADQLRRAANSIVTNIVEGAGEYALKEKGRFYRQANRSATECAGLVELFRRLALIDDESARAARSALLRIVSMLVKLAKKAEAAERYASTRGDTGVDGDPAR